MLDIKIGPTSFRLSCQLEGVHTRNKDLSLFHGCGLNNILMLSFWGPSSGIIYILLCLSTVTHALLKDQIYKTKKIQCSYNSVMAVERLVVMDQLLTTHFMSKCYTVLIFELSLACRRIGEDLHECLPNLESLVLSNNSMTELGDLDPLSNLKSLQHLRYEFLLSDWLRFRKILIIQFC